MLTARVLEDIRDAEAIRGEWSDLARRAPHGEIVMTPVWLLAWWREFGGDGRKLRMVTFRDGGRLVGLAPLYAQLVLHRHAIPMRRLALLATGEEEQDEILSEYVGILCEAGYEEAIARELVRLTVKERALGEWDEMLLPLMNGEAPSIEALRLAFAAAGARVDVTVNGHCPYARLGETWDGYLATLDGASRYEVTRAMRELDKWAGKGGASLLRANTQEELSEGRRILFSLHEARWSRAGKPGVFASARFVRFHDEVMPKLLHGVDGQLDLLWLVVNGEPIAALYNIVFRGRVCFYQSGRKVDVPKNVKPGMAAHVLAMQRATEMGWSEYDFLSGASQYKRKLATATRPLVTLRAVAPTLRARAVDAARELTEAAVEEVHSQRHPSSGPPRSR